MDRYTVKRNPEGWPEKWPDMYELVACDKDPEWCEDWKEQHECKCDAVGDCVNQLGRYEDTGLLPQEIAALQHAGTEKEGLSKGTRWFPEIVCLCGPMRFHDAYRQAEYDLELQGKIVLAPSFKPGAGEHDGTTGCTPEQKVQLDALHKKKIEMADRVLILNVGGYVGESTRSEIEHAKAHGKTVDFLEPANMASEEG